MGREYQTPYKSNSTLTQFNRTIRREGKTCTTYTGGTEFKAFFRIKNDYENSKETITIYYDVNAPVRPGTLICYGYGVFLVLNKETVENDVYYKSTLVKCNGTYTNNNNYRIGNIPFYTDNIKSTIPIGNQVMKMLDGNLEFLTEDNFISRQIEINSTFNDFGRTFKVSNRFCIDGITHIVAEVSANETPKIEYTIVIDGVPDTAEVGNRFQLSATGYENNAIISNATFEWISSNNDIATIDGSGNVTILQNGSVVFTVKWVEKNVSQNTDPILISDGGISARSASISYGGDASIVLGSRSKTFTHHFFDGTGTELSEIEPVWSITADDFDMSKLNVGYTTTNAIKIGTSDTHDDLIGCNFVLSLSDKENTCSTALIVNIENIL